MANLNDEIRFHERYLTCGLQAVPPCEQQLLEPFTRKGQIVTGNFEVTVVVFPHEIQPLVVPLIPDLVMPRNRLLVVSCSTVVNPNEELQLSTLAEIVAISAMSVSDDADDRIVLVRGLKRIRFKPISALEGEIVDYVIDEDDPQPGSGWHDAAGSILRRLAKQEQRESSFLSVRRLIPMSEDLRVKLYRCVNSLERRLFINHFQNLEDRALGCKTCWEDYNVRTIIAFHTPMVAFTNATCINPSGFVFHLLLVPDSHLQSRRAGVRNIQAHGPPHAEHSWFVGYMWKFATCSSCANMLGWQFVAEAESPYLPVLWGLRSTELLNSAATMRYFK